MGRTDDNVLLKQHLQNLISKNVLSNEIVSDLEKAILAIDREPVVRCKDCKWWNPDDCECNLRTEMYNVLSGFYCADGKRRDGDA